MGKQSSGIPEKFLERLTDIVGPSLYREIENTFVERPTTFRIILSKPSEKILWNISIHKDLRLDK